MKKNISKQSTTILGILLFSIGLLISFNTAAMPGGEPAVREAGDAVLQGQIDELQTQVDDLAPATHTVGDTLPDGSIVFWVDETGQHGLTTWPTDDASGNWYEAKMIADDHGPGWRLPTKHELDLLFLQKDVVGGFASFYYWSSTEVDATTVWDRNFGNGFQDTNDKNGADNVRAVRAF